MSKERYMTYSENDSLAALSDRLTQDLRGHIRMLGDYPVLSDEWISMANSLGRIGSISEMERQMPKKSNDETLWECEEVALRYILEDGKLNLCLRLLVNYQEHMERTTSNHTMITATGKDLFQKFEHGLSLTLKNAWLHVEAMQTTEIPMLIQYISSVFDFSAKYPNTVEEKKVHQSAEVMVIYFLMGLMKWIDELGESRIMPLFVEYHIFRKLMSHIHQFGRLLPTPDIQAAAEVMSLICDTEDFQAHSDDFLETDEDKELLLNLRDDFLDDAIEAYGKKHKFRPLLDVIRSCAREIGRK